MVPIVALWLPILGAAVLVFIASSILHVVLTYHRKDHEQLPKEEESLAALRSSGLKPGSYFFPYAPSLKEAGTEEMLEKFKRGPVGMMTVLPSGPPVMGKNLVRWFVYSLLVGVLVAYLTGRTLDAGASYLAVFRVAGTAAFLVYGVAHIEGWIWRGVGAATTGRAMFDGFLYALVTAGAFGWLWP